MRGDCIWDRMMKTCGRVSHGGAENAEEKTKSVPDTRYNKECMINKILKRIYIFDLAILISIIFLDIITIIKYSNDPVPGTRKSA